MTIEIVKAPPFATVQDMGWPVGRAIGLPEGGAMDRAALAAANRAVGNAETAAGIEIALGAGTFRFAEAAVVAVAGLAEVRLGGELVPHTLMVPAAVPITLYPRPERRFVYLAVRGGIAVPELLGSRSTYLPAGFGGYEGRRLRNGDSLPIGAAPPGSAPEPERGPEEEATGPLKLRAARGPQWDRFGKSAQAAFFAAEFRVAPASDRMGYRLLGPSLAPEELAALPSEAACPGAIQVPDGGQPIVLMPDGPTVGGYPKIAVLLRPEVGRLAQCPPGAAVRFVEVGTLL
ncbi:MAG: biotin-dependent carboxyltransferase family protein [Gemmatimonadales bacterium]|nr:biotin-dependent carboxyltransferase family protein [Gemmatimonadales bacterium]